MPKTRSKCNICKQRRDGTIWLRKQRRSTTVLQLFWWVYPIRVGEQEEETYIRIIMASKGIFLIIVLLTKIASIKEHTEHEKTFIVNKSLNYERLNMWAEVINIQRTLMRPTKMHSNSEGASLCINLMMLLINISNDINPNPGPENSTVYPCGTRDQPVTWEERGIVCDTCNQWYHATCQWSTLYQEHVNNSAIAWDWLACGCPNYSTFCFPMIFSTSNQLSVLSNNPLVPLDSPTPSIPPTPIHASTPRRQNKPSIRANKADEHLRVLNVNFQSVKTKQRLLENLIDNTKPDVMFGTETWLDHGIKDSQIFPSGYNVFRND